MNKLFLVTYDLMKQGQDYERLFSALEKLGARRALYSVWMLRGNYSVTSLRDTLRNYIDSNDRLLVCEVSDWSSWNALFDINQL